MSTAAKRKLATQELTPSVQKRGVVVPLGLILLVVLLGSGLGIWRLFFYRAAVVKGLQALQLAYREQRPTEARITGFNYAPSPSITRGSEQERVDSVARNRAERILHDEAEDHPGAQSYHTLGRLYLAEHKLVEARDQFERALKLDDKNAQIENDYGVALMEMAKADRLKDNLGKSLEGFARGLEHVNKAFSLDSSLLEALFNRALCQEYMLLYREAEKGWGDYLDKDPRSKWADEARQKHNALAERPPQTSQNKEQLFQAFLDAYKVKNDEQAWGVVCRSRDAKGGFIANKLIDDYLDLAIKGDHDKASEKFNTLSYTSGLEYRQAQDRFLPDLFAFYQTATFTQLNNIAQARRLISLGHENAYRPNPNFEEAIRLYSQAKEIFERTGDVYEAMQIVYWIGNCYLQQSKAESAISLFESLAKGCEKARYRWLLVQSLGAIANGNTYSNDLSAAIRNTSRALKLSEAMGDPIGSAKILFQLADEYRFVNNFQKAVDLHMHDLLLARIYFPQPIQLWRSYFSISRGLEELNLYTAAIDFQKEALQLATEAQAPRSMCRSYNYLAITLAKSGNYVEAIKQVERALEIGNSFPDKRVRIETAANCFLQFGTIYRKSGDFSKAVESYDQAIQFYDELESKAFSYTARKGKLLCCMAQDECPSVEQEMETVLKLFEQHRSKILEESNRNTFFDAEQNIYDVAIEFEHSKKGNPKRAFDYSERSRARSLQDLISTKVQIVDNPQSPDINYNAVSQPLNVEEIQAQMPEQTQILQYAVLKDSLLIWVVPKEKEEVFSISQSISTENLNERVRNYLQMVSAAPENHMEAISREAIDLYDLLIKPVEGRLDGSKQLCIVPDKILNYLPFGALLSSASGKYFIEEHGFVSSPSSTMFIYCSKAAREKAALGSERLLSIGNPSFDGRAFPELADLPSATKEAKAVADCYQSPCLIVEAAATKRRVKSEMEKADVIHLATHAITDEWNPMRSKLLLAKDAASVSGNDADGVLQAYEIYQLNLTRARLVVLSACQTGAEKYYGGEGVIGLSRPFIAKQLPLVVASLWPVDSDPTAELMIRFHRYRKSEGSTAGALRHAQLDMLKDQAGNYRAPYYWGAFVAIGGYASY